MVCENKYPIHCVYVKKSYIYVNAKFMWESVYGFMEINAWFKVFEWKRCLYEKSCKTLSIFVYEKSLRKKDVYEKSYVYKRKRFCFS